MAPVVVVGHARMHASSRLIPYGHRSMVRVPARKQFIYSVYLSACACGTALGTSARQPSSLVSYEVLCWLAGFLFFVSTLVSLVSY